MTALHALGVAELLALYQRGVVSPVDVAADVLDRIGRWEPHLKALYAFDPERVQAQARDSEARWRRGEPRALEGVPCTLKENIATRGVPVPLGTAATELVPATADAPPAARLAEAGAMLLAKTTMPDYGMLSSGLSTFHPLTRNPWELEQEPRRQQCRRRGRRGGRLRAAARRHRHRRLGPAAGLVVRRVRAQAEPRPHPDLPALCRPRRRADDTPRRRRGADDARAVPARCARHDEPALPADRLDHARPRPEGPAHGPADGRRLGPRRSSPRPRQRSSGGASFEAAGAIVEPMPAFSTRAMADGMDRFWRMRSWLDISRPAARAPGQGAALHPAVGRERARSLSAAEVFHGYSQMGALREAAVRGLRAVRLRAVAGQPGADLRRRVGQPDQRPASARSSTSPSRSPTT